MTITTLHRLYSRAMAYAESYGRMVDTLMALLDAKDREILRLRQELERLRA